MLLKKPVFSLFSLLNLIRLTIFPEIDGKIKTYCNHHIFENEIKLSCDAVETDTLSISWICPELTMVDLTENFFSTKAFTKE